MSGTCGAMAGVSVAAAMTCVETRMTMIHICSADDLVGGSGATPGILREGFLLRLMDLTACGSAEKFSGHASVTLGVDDLEFLDAKLSVGDLVTVSGQVNRAWNTSMECGVTVEAEDLGNPGTSRHKVCRAFFTFVALDKDGKKVKLPPLRAYSEANVRRALLANERRKLRFRRKEIIERVKSGTGSGEEFQGARDGMLGMAPQQERKATESLVSTEIVLPQHGNHHGNTFGGQIMSWMSTSARAVACRHAASTDGVDLSVSVKSISDIFFVGPSTVSDRVEIDARVTRTFGQTMEVGLVVHAWSVGGSRRLINRAFWEMQCVSEADAGDSTSWELIQVDPRSKDAFDEFERALGRRALRLERFALGGGHAGDPSFSWTSDSGLSWEELAARNVSSLLRVYYSKERAGASWGRLEASSVEGIQLYMKEDEGFFVVKAVAELAGVAQSHAFSCLLDQNSRGEWDSLCHESSTCKVLDAHNDISRLVFLSEEGTFVDFSLLRSWRQDNGGNRMVVANHSILAPEVVPRVDGCTRGAVSSSGWILERDACDSLSFKLTYIVTLAAKGVAALGHTALDVMAGRSKVVCSNIAGIARVCGGRLIGKHDRQTVFGRESVEHLSSSS